MNSYNENLIHICKTSENEISCDTCKTLLNDPDLIVQRFCVPTYKSNSPSERELHSNLIHDNLKNENKEHLNKIFRAINNRSKYKRKYRIIWISELVIIICLVMALIIVILKSEKACEGNAIAFNYEKQLNDNQARTSHQRKELTDEYIRLKDQKVIFLKQELADTRKHYDDVLKQKDNLLKVWKDNSGTFKADLKDQLMKAKAELKLLKEQLTNERKSHKALLDQLREDGILDLGNNYHRKKSGRLSYSNVLLCLAVLHLISLVF